MAEPRPVVVHVRATGMHRSPTFEGNDGRSILCAFVANVVSMICAAARRRCQQPDVGRVFWVARSAEVRTRRKRVGPTGGAVLGHQGGRHVEKCDSAGMQRQVRKTCVWRAAAICLPQVQVHSVDQPLATKPIESIARMGLAAIVSGPRIAQVALRCKQRTACSGDRASNSLEHHLVREQARGRGQDAKAAPHVARRVERARDVADVLSEARLPGLEHHAVVCRHPLVWPRQGRPFPGDCVGVARWILAICIDTDELTQVVRNQPPATVGAMVLRVEARHQNVLVLARR